MAESRGKLNPPATEGGAAATAGIFREATLRL